MNASCLWLWANASRQWSMNESKLMLRKISFMMKIRERVEKIRRFRLNGSSSPELRKALFLSFVLPLFTWLSPISPLFTRRQQEELSHFYFTCLKRISFHLEWPDPFYSFAFNEISLADHVSKYWVKYIKALSNSVDADTCLSNRLIGMYIEACRWIRNIQSDVQLDREGSSNIQRCWRDALSAVLKQHHTWLDSDIWRRREWLPGFISWNLSPFPSRLIVHWYRFLSRSSVSLYIFLISLSRLRDAVLIVHVFYLTIPILVPLCQ